MRAFRTRGQFQPTDRWSEMRHEHHASAFTVAKMARLDLLTNVQSSLDRTIAAGGSYDEWRSNILPELQRAGWWGTVQNRELTGTDEPVLINERRLRNIYRTNVRMSIAAGNWSRIQRQKSVLPYLRYVASSAEHKRPLHKTWYGTILPVDHPWWQTHFPPNGWGCKCGFEQVSAERMARRGWSVTDPPPDDGTHQWLPATGETIDVPNGIDDGFGYNPGTAHLRVLAERATASMESAVAAGLEAQADATLREIVADAAFDQFMALPDGSFPVAILGAQERQLINAQSPVVVLPTTVYRKQRGEMPEISAGHLDLTTDDYRNLPDIVANALVIAQQGDTRLVYFSDAAGRLWRAVIRQDEGRAHPAIVSFHGSSLRKIASETRNRTIILDRRT